jgi:hypothetical protein
MGVSTFLETNFILPQKFKREKAAICSPHKNQKKAYLQQIEKKQKTNHKFLKKVASK